MSDATPPPEGPTDLPPKPRRGAGLYHGVMYRLGGMLVSLGTRLQTKKPEEG